MQNKAFHYSAGAKGVELVLILIWHDRWHVCMHYVMCYCKVIYLCTFISKVPVAAFAIAST